MKTIDEHIEQVEEYGFVRYCFPISYKNHEVSILSNDAYETTDGRVLFDFTLYCVKCDKESGVSGRFPADDDNQVEHVVNAKVAVFSKFEAQECRGKSHR